MDDVRRHKIQIRAYELWELDGRQAGNDEHYWLVAEQELYGEGGDGALQEELEATFPASDAPSSVTTAPKG